MKISAKSAVVAVAVVAALTGGAWATGMTGAHSAADARHAGRTSSGANHTTRGVDAGSVSGAARARVHGVRHPPRLPGSAAAHSALASAHATAVLRAGHTLKAGQSLRSANKRYLLLQQTDGNLVLYRGTKPLWSSDTAHHRGAFAAMQTDGNLTVDLGHRALWATNTTVHHGAFLLMQDDGNVVLYDAANKPLWDQQISIGRLTGGQQLRAGQAVISPNHRYELLQQTDGNLVLYQGKKPLWSLPVAGAGHGTFSQMQTDGNFVVYNAADHALWGTGTASPGAYLAVQDDGNLVLYSHAAKPLWTRTIYVGTLPSGASLRAGQAVKSRNGRYELLQQTDGNLVLYRGSKPLWSKPGRNAGKGAFSLMQTDGNLVTYTAADHPVWSSNTARSPGAYLAVQDDGNLAVCSSANKPLWSTGTTGK